MLNYDNMPNAAGLMEWLKSPDYDEGGKYSVAYMWGTVGYLYNTTMVDRELTSWDDMFSTEFEGNVLMMDSVRDTLGVALKSLGYSMNSSSEDELREAADKLIEQKRNGVCAGYLVDEIKDKMVGGEAAIGLVWSGDALYAMEKSGRSGLLRARGRLQHLGGRPCASPRPVRTRKPPSASSTSCAAPTLPA